MGREEIGREGVKERGGGGSHDFSSSSPIKSHVAKISTEICVFDTKFGCVS